MALYEDGYFQNMDVSLLNYNERVLQEALDDTVPLFERLNYILIFKSNLGKFIQDRVCRLITEGEQMDTIYKRISELLDYKDTAHADIEEKLEKSGVVRIEPSDLLREEIDKCKKYYKSEIRDKIKVYIGSDANNFPSMIQDKPYIVSKLEGETKELYAIIDIPDELPKILVLNEGSHKTTGHFYDFDAYSLARQGDTSFRYILVEDIIRMHIAEIYTPFDEVETASINIIRNEDLEIDHIISTDISEEMVASLMNIFQVKIAQIITTYKFDYSYVSELQEQTPAWLKDDLCWHPLTGFNQLKLGYGPLIDRLKRKEILCCYPYDTMEPLLALLKDCSIDSRVKEIRMTTCRLSSHPKIVEYLEQAAQNGKKVTAVIEISARFGEDNNVDWSEKVRKKGVKIRYGNERLKIHTNLIQIVLDENGKTRYITYLGTGDFNEITAQSYTDIGLITYDQRIGVATDEMWRDILENRVASYDHILTSPRTMKETLINLIRRESKRGKNGRIFIKVNALSDQDLIEELMLASKSGCKIRMIVRDICGLLPGIEGLTENIKIVNVVGRYLEHSRVYVFGMGKEEVIYISSADLTSHDLSRRIELAVPVYNNELKRRIKAILYLNYMDNVKGRYLRSDGKYYKKFQGNKTVDSQNMLMG